jgi:hypothetical protein
MMDEIHFRDIPIKLELDLLLECKAIQAGSARWAHLARVAAKVASEAIQLVKPQVVNTYVAISDVTGHGLQLAG